MARPFLGCSLKKISNTVSACLIMHSICMSDRVTDGDVAVPGTMLATTVSSVLQSTRLVCLQEGMDKSSMQVLTTNVVQNVLDQQNH